MIIRSSGSGVHLYMKSLREAVNLQIVNILISFLVCKKK